MSTTCEGSMYCVHAGMQAGTAFFTRFILVLHCCLRTETMYVGWCMHACMHACESARHAYNSSRQSPLSDAGADVCCMHAKSLLAASSFPCKLVGTYHP